MHGENLRKFAETRAPAPRAARSHSRPTIVLVEESEIPTQLCGRQDAGRRSSMTHKMLAIARLNKPAFLGRMLYFFGPVSPVSPPDRPQIKHGPGALRKDAMNNKFVAIELHGSLPNTLIETLIISNCLIVIIRFGFSFSTERQV